MQIYSNKPFTKIFIGMAALALIAGCKSKPKVDDNNSAVTAPVNSEAVVDSTPLSFDVAGSDSGKIDGLVTVNFEYDKSQLNSDAKKKLQDNANWLKKNSKTKIQIEGHCDARGSLEYNMALGERRANAVKAYMTGLGIPGSRLKTISLGKDKPLVQGDSEDAYRQNRRANFVPLQ